MTLKVGGPGQYDLDLDGALLASRQKAVQGVDRDWMGFPLDEAVVDALHRHLDALKA